MKVVAIDIGNTSITVGLFQGGDLRQRFSMPTHPYQSADRYREKIGTFLRQHGIEGPLDGAVVSSVVPLIEDVVLRSVGELTLKNLLNVTSLTDTGLIFDIPKPEEIGSDRVADTVAAVAIMGDHVIVVDFGTATTCSCISGRRFIGGAILPGIGLMADSLGRQTSKLPRVDVVSEMNGRDSLSAVGKDTKACIVSGIIYGTAGAVERLVEEMEQEERSAFPVVITGGYAHCIARFLPRSYRHEPDLTLHGLRLIYERNS